MPVLPINTIKLFLMMIAGVLITGMLSASEYHLNDEIAIKNLIVKDTKTESFVKQDRVDNRMNFKFRVGINLFSANNVDGKTTEMVTDNIAVELSRILGPSMVVNFRKGRYGRNVNRMLMGSVAKLGKRIIISVRIVNVEKLNVIFGAIERIRAQINF